MTDHRASALFWALWTATILLCIGLFAVATWQSKMSTIEVKLALARDLGTEVRLTSAELLVQAWRNNRTLYPGLPGKE